MPNMLEVIRELKGLQAKQAAGVASPADVKRIADLQQFMTGQKKPDVAPAGPPVQAPAFKPAPQPAPVAKPAPAPVAKPAPAPKPVARAAEPEPDGGAFALSLDSDLMNELGTVDEGDLEAGSRLAATTHAAGDVDDANPFALSLEAAGIEMEPDESDAAKTTFEVDEEPVAKAAAADNPFALEVPEGLEGIGFEDNQGGVTHELDESELDVGHEEREGARPHGIALKQDFAKALDKADGSTAQVVAKGPAGQPIVPDAHYAAQKATDASVVVYLRDGRIAKGVASAFTPMAPQVSVNQLLPGKPPIAVKLDDVLTIRFVRAYNDPVTAAAPFPAKAAPGAGGVAGERVQVKMLDGETIVGTAMPHKPGENFFLLPAVATGNVRRIWISAKAVRSMTKIA